MKTFVLVIISSISTLFGGGETEPVNNTVYVKDVCVEDIITEEIITEEIITEEIIVETITFENVEVQSWSEQ